ncbi:MAG: hypothetical protein ACYTXY_01190 [Nostoc sp.]
MSSNKLSGNFLPELVSQAQELLVQIRQHPQFKGLRFDRHSTRGKHKR